MEADGRRATSGIGDGDGSRADRRSGIGRGGEREGKSTVGDEIFRTCQKSGLGGKLEMCMGETLAETPTK